MTEAAMPASAFALLAELEENNTKAWFNAHRTRIRDEVQAPFAAILDAISAALSDSPLPLSGGQQTMFRMNRDIRFSADKRPYKAHVSGLLTPSGTKAEGGGVLYLHLAPQGGFIASGFYKLSPKALAPIRDRIVAQPDTFGAMLDSLHHASLDLSRELTLKSMPQGYSAFADAWFADYLKLQAFITRTELDRSAWRDGAVVARAAQIAEGSRQLFSFAG